MVSPQVLFTAEFQTSLLDVPVQHRPRVIDWLLNLAQGYRPARYPEVFISVSATSQFPRLIHVMPVSGRKLIWTVEIDRAKCM